MITYADFLSGFLTAFIIFIVVHLLSLVASILLIVASIKHYHNIIIMWLVMEIFVISMPIIVMISMLIYYSKEFHKHTTVICAFIALIVVVLTKLFFWYIIIREYYYFKHRLYLMGLGRNGQDSENPEADDDTYNTRKRRDDSDLHNSEPKRLIRIRGNERYQNNGSCCFGCRCGSNINNCQPQAIRIDLSHKSRTNDTSNGQPMGLRRSSSGRCLKMPSSLTSDSFHSPHKSRRAENKSSVCRWKICSTGKVPTNQSC